MIQRLLPFALFGAPLVALLGLASWGFGREWARQEREFRRYRRMLPKDPEDWEGA